MDKDTDTIDTGRTGLEIAVIGMAVRFPGAADIDEFWNNLKNGVESIRFFTHRELQGAGVDPQLLENPDYVKASGVLANIEYFDAPFFEYTHREAEVMDPQVRIFHESTWKALEDAGYDPQRYPGLIGVYAGAAPNSFWEIQTLLAGMNRGDKGAMDFLSAFQLSDKDFLCTRVSYKLDLKGPSFPIYTTCSTSLVAIHLAVQGLLGGECDIAAAGGVRVTYPRAGGYLYHEGMVYSPDGHCRAFAAKARGIVGGEGVGVVVLKRLADAVRDGDNIYAVVKGSAVNNDGKRKVGFAAPSIKGQSEVIKAALRMGDVNRESIGCVETHGTATIMGDPVEVEALKMAFNTGKTGFCALGSVKTNIGHTDAAAGAAGFIKTVLALKHRVIPPSLHFETPNPEIDFENSPFYVNTEPTPWKRLEGYPRRAGVSSFGIGGTNAHVILEERPESRRSDNREAERPQLILLSAKTPSALDRMTENLGNYLKDNHGNPGNPVNPGFRLADAAYTLQVGRGQFDCRRMLVCSGPGEAAAALTLKQEESYEAYHTSDKLKTFFNKGDRREVVFMFPGQGSQYVDMGRDLYRTEPVFREVMDRCFEILKSPTGCDIKPIIYPGANERWSSLDRVRQAEIIQPFIFSFEYALAQLLMAWGIKPHALIGYSLGEYPAVCLAGVLSLEHALDLAAFRGRLTAQQPERVMLNVPMPEEELRALLTEEGFNDVSIAVVNEPSCIAAGSREAIETLKNRLKEKRVMSMGVDVPQATHWVMTDSTLQEFQQKIRQLDIKPPEIPVISCVTGEWITAKEVEDPAFWSRLLNDTVRFSRGIRNLIEIKKEKNPVFIEVGPGRDLTVMVRRYMDEKAGQQAVNLVRPRQQEVSDDYYLLERIGRLWLYGVPIDWEGYYNHEKRFRISLPTYSFDKYRYWPEPDVFRFAADILSGKETPEMDTGMETIREKPGESAPETLYVHFEQGRRSVYAAPQNPLQHRLAHIWQDFFGLPRVGIDDDFFELGGDSLKAITMVNRIHRETDVRVPLEEFFKRPGIRVLSEYIETADKEAFQLIHPAEEKKYYPLSPAQKRNYILQQMSPDSIGYNLGAGVTLEGVLDKEKFTGIFKTLIKRHESFRTSFFIIEKEPVQKIHDDVEFKIEYYDLDVGDTENIIKNFTRSFDLSQAPLLRVSLIKQDERKHIFMVDMHHIITDGTSLANIITDFSVLYRDETPAPLKVRYRDFSQWLVREGMTRVEKEKQYWLRQFETDAAVMDLPCDFPRPGFQGFTGNTVPFLLESTETNILKKYAKEADATLYMVVLTLFTIFIAKLTGREDIVVGTPVAGRSHPDLQPIVGVFINTLAMRNYPNGDLSFNRFLEEVKGRTLAAFDNQGYPFEELVEIVTAQGGLQRDVSRNPIFDLFFSFENVNIPEIEMPGLTLKPFDSKRTAAIFDLSLYCLEAGTDDGDRLLCRFEYSTNLFKEETIQRFIGYFRKIVTAVVTDPTVKTADIEIITREEMGQILEEFNDTRVDYSIDKTVQGLFAEQAEKRPDSIAVVGKSLRTRSFTSVTYGEIDGKSGQLSRLLRSKGVKPDSIVGIMVERSLEMIIGVLAILKAGGACLPIDPDYPEERVDFMLKESSAKILLSEVSKVSEGTEVVQLSELSEELTTHLTHLTHLTHPTHPTHLCYVIYTSGTTGKPKGVVLEHRTPVNLAEHQYRFTSIDFSRVLQFAALTFDVSFQEIVSTLGCGGTLYLIPQDMRSNVTELFAYVRRHNIKTLFLPTAFLKFIQGNDDYLECIPAGVDHIVTAGEQLIVNRGLKDYLRTHGIHLHNHYGPSETHVVTALSMVPGEEIADIPSIGKPLSNIDVYIVDQAGHWQPLGVAGELLIGGFQVARGYLNNPELTAERFDHDKKNKSFLGGPGGRFFKKAPLAAGGKIYKTGDLARWLVGGNIEFLGRMDRQVKIRGFRVELGEIESQLLRHPHVKEAVVVDSQREDGEKYLCAYVAYINHDGTVELREYLSRMLPDYMIPAHFIPVEKVPLTSSGKVDRRVLPGPRLEVLGEGAAAAPRNPIEEKLAVLWSEVLGVEQSAIGIDDNFFRLGGHSLKATLLVSGIHKEFDARVQLAEVFKRPTIRGLAQHIAECVEEVFISIQPVEEKEHYILSSAQRRIFILHQVEENSITYNIPSVVVLEGVIDLDRLEDALGRLIRRQEILRTSFDTIFREPRQRIHPVDEISFAVEFIEDPDSPASTVKNFIRPFDFSRAPLMRVGLIKTGETNHVLVVDMHHIITDGTSLGIFVRELLALYSGGQLPELRLQYKDFAEWQTGVQRSEYLDKSLKKQEQYWLNQFAGDVPQLAMSTDFPRPPVQSFEGHIIVFGIDAHWTAEIRGLVRETGTTVYMVLLAIFNILLSKYCIQDDIIVGTGVAGRRHADLQNLIGIFVNMLPMRNYPGEEKCFNEFFQEVKKNAVDAFENQEYQFEELVEKLEIPRDPGRNPIFDVEFTLQNTGLAGMDISIPGIRLRPFEAIEIEKTKFDLVLQAVEDQEKINLSLSYSTKLFKRSTVEKMSRHYREVLQQVLENRDVQLGDIRLSHQLSTAEAVIDKEEDLFDF
jgi:amino acid adenylation domain-containing protein